MPQLGLRVEHGGRKPKKDSLRVQDDLLVSSLGLRLQSSSRESQTRFEHQFCLLKDGQGPEEPAHFSAVAKLTPGL